MEQGSSPSGQEGWRVRRELTLRENERLLANSRLSSGTPSAFDEVDQRILHLLIEDSRRTNKEIGQEVHLTGQAVGARIRRMQDNGVIEGYTLRWNPGKIGLGIEAFVTVFLDAGTLHAAFVAFAQADDRVTQMDRTNGEGCYLLQVQMQEMAELNDFLQDLLRYGNYRVNLSMGRLKG